MIFVLLLLQDKNQPMKYNSKHYFTIISAFLLISFQGLSKTFTVNNQGCNTCAGGILAAIDSANMQSSADTILFDTTGWFGTEITFFSMDSLILDDPFNGTFIDGDINGDHIPDIGFNFSGTASDGIVINSNFNWIQHLRIYGCYSGAGIKIQNGGTENTIIGCYIGGLDAFAQSFNFYSNQNGVEILNGSNNHIGDPGLPYGRNIISKNGNAGVKIHGGSSNNDVFGNYIGVNINGNDTLSNGFGIIIDNAINNHIGDPNVGGGNIISGNLNAGIHLGLSATSNKIYNNLIGLGQNGDMSLANDKGIVIQDNNNNQIGGSNALEGNVISGNTTTGIEILNSHHQTIQGNYIGTDSSGTLPRGNLANGIMILSGSHHVEIGGDQSGEGNLISGNNGVGVLIDSSSQNFLGGNIIGADESGTSSIPNTNEGVVITNHSDTNNIGNENIGSRNIISGNNGNGIGISVFSSYNLIRNTYVGLGLTGDSLENMSGGINISNSSNNVIGGTLKNVISLNNGNGIHITSSDSCWIAGNYIGTDTTGMLSRGNQGYGIWVQGSDNIQIGENNSVGRNLICDNQLDGIFIDDASNKINIVNNFIGIGSNGAKMLGNAYNGVRLDDNSDSVSIGGDQPGDGNVISNNGEDGIHINDNVNETIIRGNLIGTDSAGMLKRGNSFAGIYVGSSQTNDNYIGGLEIADRNIISGNQYGIDIDETNNIFIAGNYIGTNIDGTDSIPNEVGVNIYKSDSIYVGTDSLKGYNIISGNSDNAIDVNKGRFIIIEGNLIGLNASGNDTIANGEHGVFMDSSTANSYINKNTISGNTLGIALADSCNSIFITGNYIGTDTSGMIGLGNRESGIDIDNGCYEISIGGEFVSKGNLISGNANNGINMNGAYGGHVLGNIIGLNKEGNDSIPNEVGIVLGGSSRILIGADSAKYRNVLSGNKLAGILHEGSYKCLVVGNYIGTDFTGENPMPNNGFEYDVEGTIIPLAGIVVAYGTQKDTIYKNIIAFNAGHGISVLPNDGDTTRNNIFWQNSIHSNVREGIFRKDTTQEDVLPPVITQLKIDSMLKGKSAPLAFINVYQDKENEGEIYLGNTVANVNGDWSLKIDYVDSLNITATQDSAGNTSAFSEAFDGYDIEGNIYLGDISTDITEGFVYLYPFDSSSTAALKVIDSVDIVPDGSYKIDNVFPGKYMLLAKPNKTSFPNTLPTYFGDKVRWFNAKPLLVDSIATEKNIIAPDITPPTGTGVIRGKVQEGLGYTKVLGPGDPLNGLDVSLIDKSVTKTVAFTQTGDNGGASGVFEFTGLEDKEYLIHIDVAGIPIDTNTVYTISNDTQSITNIIVTVDSNFIYFGKDTTGDTTTPFVEENQDLNNIVISPNPFNDAFKVQLYLEKGLAKFELYDLNGNVVHRSSDKVTSSGVYTYRYKYLEHLADGIYLLKVVSGNNILEQRITKIN